LLFADFHPESVIDFEVWRESPAGMVG